MKFILWGKVCLGSTLSIQISRVMRLIALFMTVAFLQVNATGFSQNISVSGKNIPLEHVFKSIEKQSGYFFLYKYDEIEKAKPISIDLKNVPLEKALKSTFMDLPFNYLIEDKTIVVSIKKEAKVFLDIRGRVVNEDGEPLAGASIAIENSVKKTTTGSMGEFTIPGLSPGTYKLSVSYLGYNTLHTDVVIKKTGNPPILNLTMKPAENSLDEVLVTGYGTVRRRDLTGSLEKVNMDDAIKAPVRSFEEMLAGRIAGVQVGSTDGQPGAAMNIVIRGNNSISQSSAPLYVIDGFPEEDPDNNVISPQDIESIEVLKDASATAIYGARGSNGVIMITTKRGKEGPPTINLSLQQGYQQIINKMDLMSPYEYLKYQLERDKSIAPGSPSEIYLGNGLTLDSYKDVKGIDWQSMMFRTAPMRDYSASLTGGTKQTKYAVSASIFDQDGIVINSGYKRYQGRGVLDQIVSKKLKVGINFNYSYLLKSGISPSTSTNSATTNLLYSLYGYRPMVGVAGAQFIEDDLFDDDLDNSQDYRINPIINQKNLVRNVRTNNIKANGYLEYTIIPNLVLRVTGGLTNQLTRYETFNNSNTLYGNKNTVQGSSNGVNGAVTYYENFNWLNENTLTWKKKIKDHSFDILGGVSEQTEQNSGYGFRATNLPFENLGINGLKNGTISPSVTSASSPWSLVSFLGRANYNYKSKYYLTTSFRADGSSRFAPENRWGYFPSGAISWRFSSEEFMSGVKAISEGKLRMSYGLTGNNRVSDFPYLPTFGAPIGSTYIIGNEYIPSNIPLTLENRDLKWETTAQFDAGIDLGLLKNRINITVDIYSKKTYDLLLNASVPTSTGFSSVYKNIGKVQNRGLEFSVNASLVKNKTFSWSSNFNIAFNRSKVLELAENQASLTRGIGWDNNWSGLAAYVAKVGEPLGQMYGYIWEGVYQYSDFDQTTAGTYILKSEVPTNGKVRAQIQPGDIKYRDMNGDGVASSLDYTVIGRGLPIHIGGFNNSFTYKQFDLNVFLQWSYGNDVMNANRIAFEGNGLNKTYLNQFASYQDRWSPENTGSTMFRPNGFYGGGYSTRTVEDGSYLRLKTVSFGYNFKPALLKKIGLKKLRVFSSAQNLLTITGYSGVDPEVNNYNSVLTPGFDYSSYPRAKTLTFGAKVTL
jgi:TonB-linked SusC/RagA family outer membrane protein